MSAAFPVRDLIVVLFTFAILLVVWTVRQSRFSSELIACIPGPKSRSWIFGNMLDLLLAKEYGEHEFKWLQTYGPVYSVKGYFGEHRLMVSDPSTLKYILSSPRFALGHSQRKITTLLFGKDNMLIRNGESHRHIRNIINPWFSSKSVRLALPAIRENVRKVIDQWEAQGVPGNTFDISQTLHNSAMDIMGDALLEYRFDTLTGQSELSKIQRTILDSASSPTELGQLADATLSYIPDGVVLWASHLPIPSMQVVKTYQGLTEALSSHLVQQKRETAAVGADHSLIGHLTGLNTTDSSTGVPDEEIPIHLRTLLVGGGDTVASAIGWTLYKIAQMEGLQQELRNEIQSASRNGLDDLDYDNMPFLNAMINEVLRLFAPFPLAERVATEDCVLPLSHPVVTTTGRPISEIPIKKGQSIFVAISAYHRLTSIWGPDALEFRPSRWFEEEPCKGSALGPHRSLLTFLAGPHVCPGWRFALLEIQVFVTEIVHKFVLSLPDNDSVRPSVAVTLVSKTADGVQQLPIHIEAVV
ncbi:cytochrome P450 [Mycena olivaceomarginata]|nr:cytochrome P450 [Mycena olivaceomarginata]